MKQERKGLQEFKVKKERREIRALPEQKVQKATWETKVHKATQGHRGSREFKESLARTG